MAATQLAVYRPWLRVLMCSGAGGGLGVSPGILRPHSCGPQFAAGCSKPDGAHVAAAAPPPSVLPAVHRAPLPALNPPLASACRRKIYTVLRSPHVNKDSREQFEVRLHQRLIDVKDLTSQTVDKLMSLDLPAGVDVEVRRAAGKHRHACMAACCRAGALGAGRSRAAGQPSLLGVVLAAGSSDLLF